MAVITVCYLINGSDSIHWEKEQIDESMCEEANNYQQDHCKKC